MEAISSEQLNDLVKACKALGAKKVRVVADDTVLHFEFTEAAEKLADLYHGKRKKVGWN